MEWPSGYEPMSLSSPSSLSRTNSALRSSSAIVVIRLFAALSDASSWFRAFPEKAGPLRTEVPVYRFQDSWRGSPDRAPAGFQPRGSPFSGDAVGTLVNKARG